MSGENAPSKTATKEMLEVAEAPCDDKLNTLRID